MRVYCLFALVGFFSIYAYWDWFKSLCVLILLMSVIEHPDMPNQIMGIGGLNPWNVLLFNVLVAWWMSRRQEGLVWDMPRSINGMLLLYLGVVLIAFARMLDDKDYVETLGFGYVVRENLINTVKWVLPGLLLFDGCRTRERLLWAVSCTLAVYFLLAVQVIRWVPVSLVFGDEFNLRARKLVLNEVGYHAVNMSRMLAGGFWAVIAMLPLLRRRWQQGLIIGAALVILLGQALTGGRMGYLTWGVLGVVLCLLRWRRYLLVAPVVPIVFTLVFPGATQRMLQGFGVVDVTGDQTVDTYTVSAGRLQVWPYVVDQINESPLIGYGREAMVRTGLTDRILAELGDKFAHPHNAYLQWLLDNGVVGLLMIMPFYVVIVLYAGRLFLAREDPLYSAVGGVALAIVLALLVAGLASQTFYPREAEVGLWCAIGMMLRVHVARSQALARQRLGGGGWRGASARRPGAQTGG